MTLELWEGAPGASECLSWALVPRVRESLLPPSQLAAGAGASAAHAFHWVMRSPPGLESIPVGLSSLLFFNYSPESQ